MMKILTISNRKDKKFLKKKVKEFTFSKKEGFSIGRKKFSKKEIDDLISKMKKTMREANGVGLSANQIGLNGRMFVAEIPDREGSPKFYAVFNPKLEKNKKAATSPFEEGCLSIPDLRGTVKRSYRVKLTGWDKNGKKIKINAWGILAHIFQHEVDHLGGILFTDQAEKTYPMSRAPNS